MRGNYVLRSLVRSQGPVKSRTIKIKATGKLINSVFATILVMTAFLFADALQADAIRLNSGQVIEGKILEESASTVVIETAVGPMAIDKKDILEVEREGKDPRIARLSANYPSPGKAAGSAFLPFYSPLYDSDSPTLGVPFAVLSGLGALALINSYTGAAQGKGYGESSMINDLTLIAFTHHGSLLSTFPGYSTETTLTSFVPSFMEPWFIAQFTPVYGYKLNGKFVTKEEMSSRRKLYGAAYLVPTLIHAGISYFYFKKRSGGKKKSTYVPGEVSAPLFYALPTSDKGGYQFGLVSTF